jgi:Endodeoxyribonuclease RusA.
LKKKVSEEKRIKLELSSLPVPKSNRYIRKKGGVVFKPPRVKNWEMRAVWEIKQQYQGEPLEGKTFNGSDLGFAQPQKEGY